MHHGQASRQNTRGQCAGQQKIPQGEATRCMGGQAVLPGTRLCGADDANGAESNEPGLLREAKVAIPTKEEPCSR